MPGYLANHLGPREFCHRAFGGGAGRRKAPRWATCRIRSGKVSPVNDKFEASGTLSFAGQEPKDGFGRTEEEHVD